MKRLVILIAFLILPLASVAAAPLYPTGAAPKSSSSISSSSSIISGSSSSGSTTTPNPCERADITILQRDSMALQKIKDALQYYSNPACLSATTGRFELRFNFPEGSREVNEPLTMVVPNIRDVHNVYISNLKLNKGASFPPDRPLLQITNNNTGTVTIDGLILSGVKNGMQLSGSGPIDVINSEISGNGEGTCLILRGVEQTIKHSNFHGCNEGVRLNGEAIFLGASGQSTFATEANDIHDNKVGVAWIYGGATRFPFNKIYNNARIADIKTSDDAISFDPAWVTLAREAFAVDFLRPDVYFSDESKEQALFCTWDDAGRVASRFLHFKPGTVAFGQEIVIYKSDIAFRNHQAEDYLTKCTVTDNDQCSIVFPSSMAVPDDKCGVDIYVAALINDPNYTSMLTPTPFKINGHPTLVATGPTVDIPSVPMEASGEAPEVEDTSSDSGTSSMTADAAGGSTTTAVEGPGVSVMEAGADAAGTGGGKVGCTMINHGPTPPYKGGAIILWWLIFATPAVLVMVRIKRRK